jgi:hypothetical protein
VDASGNRLLAAMHHLLMVMPGLVDGIPSTAAMKGGLATLV